MQLGGLGFGGLPVTRGVGGQRRDASPQVAALGLRQRVREQPVAITLLTTCSIDEELDPGPLIRAHRRRELLEREQFDIRVAARAERIGQGLYVAQHRAQLIALEARRVDLHDSAQAPCGDAHRVDALDVTGVEHSGRVLEDLLAADRDRPRGGLRVRHRGVKPGNLGCLGQSAPQYR